MPSEMAIDIAPNKYFPSSQETFRLDCILPLILSPKSQRYLSAKTLSIFVLLYYVHRWV